MSSRIKYKEWIEEAGLKKVEAWAKKGLTNEQIAKNMGVGRQTLAGWRKKYPCLDDALKKGREPVVEELVNQTLKIAMGYPYEESKVEEELDEDGNVIGMKRTTYYRYALPNSSMAMFLLKNWKPNEYRNYNDMTKKQIEADIAKTQSEVEKAKAEASLLNHEVEKLEQSGESFELLKALRDVKNGDSQ
ncbi:MAG: helix-turn-helix domain-containing protein [Aerococcus suis]|nr:helix-turn-helix domain-containing protein [Aerococcus suis]